MEKKSKKKTLSSSEVLFELRGVTDILLPDDFAELVNCGKVLKIKRHEFSLLVINLQDEKHVFIDPFLRGVDWQYVHPKLGRIRYRDDCSKPAMYYKNDDRYYYFDHEGNLVKSYV